MRIVLVAIDCVPHLGTSFKDGLRQLGHEVRVVDERWAFSVLDRRPFRAFVRSFAGPGPSLRRLFRTLLLRTCAGFQPQAIIAIKGLALYPDLLREMKSMTAAPLVMYSTDNPFNPVVSSPESVESLPLWDLIATPRKANLAELQCRCAGKVIYLPFGYDPALHFHEMPATAKESEKMRSEVVFMGGCDADRIPFLVPLAEAKDLTVRLYGGYYRRLPKLRHLHRGFAYGRRYRMVLSSTKVALCLVRRANEDGHVMRTFEIPACGAFLLAERTSEHQEMFVENKEAVFFDGPEEMLDKARFYARHEDLRQRIAHAGHVRVTKFPNTYCDRLGELMQQVEEHAGCR